ncbi:MAG: hypothetical protein GDA46_00415 [Bdellovibrionales bacterium]|nr:hypothetical protein [Bdellovibrionales bacterium]
MIKNKISDFLKKKAIFLFSWKVVFLFFFLFLFILSYIFFEKEKKVFFNLFRKQYIKKLSRVEFEESGSKFRIIKLKKKDKIYLEILSEQSNQSYQEVQVLELTGNREAYFDYWEERFSLSVFDYDGDGTLDIGATTFDSFFKPHFHLLVYNKKDQKFNLRKLKYQAKVEVRPE